jgi:hypothetical protein
MIDNLILFGIGLLVFSIIAVVGEYFFGDEE